jgi:DNA modification methylase
MPATPTQPVLPFLPVLPAAALVWQGDSRRMPEVASGSIALAVTSPPYWQIKDYGEPGQIGHGQRLHEYLRDLGLVWEECFRALHDGGRLCVNIGDQFARASVYGRYRVIPLHAEVICQCMALGFDYLGAIIWRKKTTMRTTGGATIMGSYPHPPNGIVEIDFEYILLFKKPGPARKLSRAQKDAAAMSRDEWKLWFSGHWDIAGARKKGHEAPFPDEVPRRLIRMFSFPGDTVLDPFLGTGTTARVALALGRYSVGYEIHPGFAAMARDAIASEAGEEAVRVERCAGGAARADVARSSGAPGEPVPTAAQAALGNGWQPRIPDLEPPARLAEAAQPVPRQELLAVVGVEPDCSLVLSTGLRVHFLGVRIVDHEQAHAYLAARVMKKKVSLERAEPAGPSAVRARVVLRNRICINTQLLKSGAAVALEGVGDGA